MIYSYEAKDGGGRTITGSLDADDERTAARQVRDMGYFLMRLAPSGPAYGGASAPSLTLTNAGAASASSVSPWIIGLRSIWTGVGLRDLALFYRQFATLIHAGVPIYQSLTTLEQQTRNGALRGCIRAIGQKVQAGGSLGAAMAQFPWIFTDFHRAMVAAGEITGRLDLMFARMADGLEQEHALRGNIIRETWYPTMVFVMSFLLQPSAAVALVVKHDVRGYLVMAGVPLLEFLILVLTVCVLTRIGSQFKGFYDGIVSNLPAIGGAVRMIAMARFARALSLLYAAGVPMSSALHTAAAASGNVYLAKKMRRAIPALQRGDDFAPALAATGAFPQMVITMLSVGEQTGDLDATMTKVAEYFEQEAAVRLHQLSVTLGVVVTILVGYRVLMAMISFYGGYYKGLLNMDPGETVFLFHFPSAA